MRKVVRHIKRTIPLICVCWITVTCTEPFDFEAEEFEDILVIDANITDENKRQEVFLSRTQLSAEDEEVLVSGAVVSVEDDLGTVYQFQEMEAGRYVSDIDFGAVQGREYRLHVRTNDGGSYTSDPALLPPEAEIEELEAVSITNENGTEGVGILVSGSVQGGGSGFFRYEYEETYSIVSPIVSSEQFVVVSENPPVLELVLKDREERVCYNTQVSNTIVITDTEGFSENRVSDFRIRFIPKTDAIIASRYSILVKQFVQSREANAFYKTLQEFSGVESLFLQTQPGFIGGNISSDNDPNERILGLFEVTSVVTQRIFFNFEDIFPEEDPFSLSCEVREIGFSDPDLFTLITSGRWRYVDTNVTLFVYLIAPSRCVDCTFFGTTVEPDFWED